MWKLSPTSRASSKIKGMTINYLSFDWYENVSAVCDATSMKLTVKCFFNVCKNFDNINATRRIVGRPSNPP